MNKNLFTEFDQNQNTFFNDDDYDDEEPQLQQLQSFDTDFTINDKEQADGNCLLDEYLLINENKRNTKNLDYPPFSRLFVLYPKTATEDELKKEFEKYGCIEDLWIVKEKETGTAKGIAYIKYGKASQAAKAIEELNGKLLNNKHAKPLKVIISNSKNDKKLNSQSNNNTVIDNDRMLRLFVVIPKDFRKKDLRDAFKKFGEIENVQIIFNRLTNENKGFGYVRFYKASDAARALEECHPKFKPKFAEPYSVKLAREREKNTAKILMHNSNSMNSITNSATVTNNNNSLNYTLLPTSSVSSQNNTYSFTTTPTLTQSMSSSFISRTLNDSRPLSKYDPLSTSTSKSSSSSSSTLPITTPTNLKTKFMTQSNDFGLLIKCSSTSTILTINELLSSLNGTIELQLISSLITGDSNHAYCLIKCNNDEITANLLLLLNRFLMKTGEILNITPIDSNNFNNLNQQLILLNKLSSLQISTPPIQPTMSQSSLSQYPFQQQQQQQQLNNYKSLFSSNTQLVGNLASKIPLSSFKD